MTCNSHGSGSSAGRTCGIIDAKPQHKTRRLLLANAEQLVPGTGCSQQNRPKAQSRENPSPQSVPKPECLHKAHKQLTISLANG